MLSLPFIKFALLLDYFKRYFFVQSNDIFNDMNRKVYQEMLNLKNKPAENMEKLSTSVKIN